MMFVHFVSSMALSITTNDLSSPGKLYKNLYQKHLHSASAVEEMIDPSPKIVFYAGLREDYYNNLAIVASIVNSVLSSKGVPKMKSKYLDADPAAVCHRDIKTHFTRRVHSSFVSFGQDFQGLFLTEFVILSPFHI